MLLALLVLLPSLLSSCQAPRRAPGPEDQARASASAAAPEGSAAPEAPAAPEDAAAGGPAGSPPLAPSPALRVVVADSEGDLCVLDPDSGAVLSRLTAGATDLIASRAHDDQLVVIEPGDDSPGNIARYELRNDALKRRSTLPFDALDGRLIDDGDATTGLAISEIFSLFRATEQGAPGRAWSPVFSAASRPADGSLRLVTVAAPDEGSVQIEQAIVSPQGISPAGSFRAPAGCGLAVFAGPGSFGRVTSLDDHLRVSWSGDPLDDTSVEAPGACVRGALWLGPSRGLAVLTGPSPALHLLRPHEHRLIPLGEGTLDEPSLLEHRLAFDPGRDRLWIIVNHELRAVSLDQGRVVAVGACSAEAVAVR